jgi:hypothetical protein
MNISEDTYFEWMQKLNSQKNLMQYVRLAFVIFTKVQDKDLYDEVTNNFLRKCYIDNLLVTKSILMSILHTYTGCENEGIEENIVKTLSVLHKVRTHLATRLLERDDDPTYASNLRRFDKVAYIDMYRCSLHIKSCEFYSSQYEFEKYEVGEMTLLARFNLLFRQIHANRDGKDKFIDNIDACLRNPLKRNLIRGYRTDQSSRCN